MKVFDAFVAYKFIKLLSTPFDKTDAYERGIIDAKGNILKKRKDLIDSKDKAAYPSNVYTLVWNLQKILNKVPIVKTRIGKFATALYLLKEESGEPLDPMLVEAVSMHYGLNSEDLLSELEGKAILMENKEIRLTSHREDTHAVQLQERYGDSVLSWRDLPDDEREDIALLIFREKEAAKIAREPWVMISKRVQDKLIKALEKETDGLVTLEESRYGDAELDWDAMPEDEKFDVAEIAFGERKAEKIAKMKWSRIDPRTKKTLIKTMEDETDGFVTIKEEEFRSWDQMPREEKLELAMIAFEGDEKYAKRVANKKWRQLSTFSHAALMTAMTQATDGAMELTASMHRTSQSARDHFRKLKRKGVVPAIDRERYPNREREGLEGPYRTKKGLIYYYDRKEGKYYDPDTDMYLDVSDVMESTIVEESEHEITVGGYTTKFFHMCGSAIEAMKKHSDVEGAEEMTKLQDQFYRMEKAVMNSGSATDEQKAKAKDLYDKIIGLADKAGIKDEIDKYMKMHRDSILKGDPEPGFGRVDVNETASGMPLKAIPATYRFEDKKSSQAFTKAVKVNYSSDTAIATSDGRIAHVEFFTKDNEVRRRISKLAKDMRGKVIGESVERRTVWTLDELAGSTPRPINEWWEDQANKRSRGWKNGRVAINFQTYNAAGQTRKFKEGDDIYYHPVTMDGMSRKYKLVIAAEDPRKEGTYFAVHPDRLGLKGYDSATGPLMNSESVSLDEAKKQSVFMYEFPDERSAMMFADEINGMGKQPGLMAVVGYDNDVDVYSDKELMKVKISGLADKHGGRFTGQSKQFREDIGTTTQAIPQHRDPSVVGIKKKRKKKLM